MAEQEDKKAPRIQRLPDGTVGNLHEWLMDPADHIPKGMTKQEFEALCLEKDREDRAKALEMIMEVAMESGCSPQKTAEMLAAFHQVWGPDPEDIQ